jgi:hypothetical protein
VNHQLIVSHDLVCTGLLGERNRVAVSGSNAARIISASGARQA